MRVLRGADAGTEVVLERGSLLVGSAGSNDVVLSDPTVSRAHLELRVLEEGIEARDLGSSNGTFLGGTRITCGTLQGPTVIKVGKTELIIEPADRQIEIGTDVEQLGAMVGTSCVMRELFGKVVRIAPANVSVLLQGETGTGKELVAQELHQHSTRAGGPFVVVDCGALPGGLVESELFGHLRGAFTGAVASRAGAFESASGGTLFLDEVGEMPLELQPKLLRVLEQRQVKRVGDDRVRDVDVRVVAATSRDLSAEVKRGKFRSDLFFRLAVVKLSIPPLRERLSDLEVLTRRIAADVAGREVAVPEAVIAELATHSWPGNVRELRNVVSHALALRRDAAILELPAVLGLEGQVTALPSEPGEPIGYRSAKRRAVDAFEVRYLTDLLERHAWNVSSAAREAGVDRNYLHRLMKRHGIRRPGG
jgi:transcriptional regulator with GAF, ATPase, and Fis domain